MKPLNELTDAELMALDENAPKSISFKNPSVATEFSGISPSIQQDLSASPIPLTITSGRRSPETNSMVGGVPNSAHLQGSGVDIRKTIKAPETISYLKQKGYKVLDEGDHIHAEKRNASFAQPSPAQPDISSLSDAELMAMDDGTQKVGAPEKPEDMRDNSLLGIASGMARQLPIPEGLAGGLVRADVVDPVMNAINYFKTGETKPYSFTQSFKRGAEITPKSITDINKRNPIASTVGGIATAIPEYAIGAEGVGMGPGTGLGTNLLKGAGLNTLIGQGARGLAFDPKANAIDAAFGAGGELADAGAQKLLGKLPAKLMNSALSTPAKVLEKGSTLGQDLVDRGVWGTQGSLRRQAADMSSNLEDQLQNVLSSKSGTNVDSQSILDTLENLKQSKSAVFGGSKDAAYVQDVIDEIKQHPAFGNLDAPQANVMKRAVYKGIGSPGYLKDNPSIRLEADKAIGRSLKNSIEDVAPEAGPINKELGIYSQLNKYAQKQSAKDSIKSLFSPFRIGTDLLAAKAAGPLGPMAAELGRTTIGKTGSAQLINQALKNQILRYLGTIGSTGINSQMP